MNYAIGEKVRFLNSKEKGTIAKIISNSKVMVNTDDGFELPCDISELVPDAFPTGGTKAAASPLPLPILESRLNESHHISSNTQVKDKLLICFEAADATKVSSCDLLVGLVNTTDFHLLLAYFFPDEGHYKWQNNVTVEPHSVVNLFRLKREKINECREIRFQILWYKKEKFEVMHPVETSLKVKQDKLFIERNYEYNDYVAGKSVLWDLYSMALPLTISEESLRKLMEGTKPVNKDNFKVQFAKQQQQRNDEREIDLHIEELVENFAGMSNAEIVQLQLRHFVRELDEAIALKLKKLIVIHGVGTGRLKAEVIRTLEHYPKVNFRDASYAKYGFGATEIVIF